MQILLLNMASQPDKLFRDKLGTYEKAAPPAAWDRIEVGLQKPRRSFLLMKIAASVLVLGAGSYFLWPTDKAVDVVYKVDDVYEVVDEVDVVDKVDKVDVVDRVDEVDKVDKVEVVKKRSNYIQQPKGEIKSTQVPIAESNIPAKNIRPENSTPIVIAKPEIKTTIEVTQQEPTETVAFNPAKSTLHFAANEVNAKYKKKSPLVQTTPVEKNPSILQKIADVALDITQDDGLLGELREKKNEILSLDRLSRSHGPNK